MVKAFWYIFLTIESVSLLFFLLIWYLCPLFQHKNNSLDENKLTFTKPIDESLNNQNCTAPGGSIKIRGQNLTAHTDVES